MVLYGKYPLEMEVLYGFIWFYMGNIHQKWMFYMVLYGDIWENHGNIWGYPAWLCQTKSEVENGPLIVGLTVQDGDFLQLCS